MASYIRGLLPPKPPASAPTAPAPVTNYLSNPAAHTPPPRPPPTPTPAPAPAVSGALGNFRTFSEASAPVAPAPTAPTKLSSTLNKLPTAFRNGSLAGQVATATQYAAPTGFAQAVDPTAQLADRIAGATNFAQMPENKMQAHDLGTPQEQLLNAARVSEALTGGSGISAEQMPQAMGILGLEDGFAIKGSLADKINAASAIGGGKLTDIARQIRKGNISPVATAPEEVAAPEEITAQTTETAPSTADTGSMPESQLGKYYDDLINRSAADWDRYAAGFQRRADIMANKQGFSVGGGGGYQMAGSALGQAASNFQQRQQQLELEKVRAVQAQKNLEQQFGMQKAGQIMDTFSQINSNLPPGATPINIEDVVQLFEGTGAPGTTGISGSTWGQAAQPKIFSFGK